MVSFQYCVVGVDNIERATTFWCSLLDYRSDPLQASDRWRTLRPAAGIGPSFALMQSSTPAPEQPRSHLDLAVHGKTEQLAINDQVMLLGGAAVAWDDYPDDPDFIVLADTEGNRFCVVDLDHDPPATIGSTDLPGLDRAGIDDLALPESALPPEYYSEAGVPVFEQVRERMIAHSAQASGEQVLDERSDRAKTEQFDTQRLEQAGRDRLEQLRRSLQERS